MSLLSNIADDIGSLRKRSEHAIEMAAEDNFVVEVVDDDSFAEKKRLVCSTVRRAAAAAAPLDDIILDEIITTYSRLFSLVGCCMMSMTFLR